MIAKSAKLITIEGSDGSGKETQSRLLYERLTRLGKKVAMVSFPRYKQTAAGWALFEALKGPDADKYQFARVDSYTASLFYAADRKQSLPELHKLIDTHNVVILDRYVESNLLHQGGKFYQGEKPARDGKLSCFAEWLFDLEYGMLQLPRPSDIVYLKLPFEISRRRAYDRARQKGEMPDSVERDDSYLKNSYEAGLFYAEKFNWATVSCIDPTGRELSQDEVHELLFRTLSRRHSL
jgi:dTMP kinase